MLNTTLCYIERDGKYLMIHRVKKENDMNKDKWISILLDGTAGKDDIEALLAMSYLLTADRIPKRNVRQKEGA